MYKKIEIGAHRLQNKCLMSTNNLRVGECGKCGKKDPEFAYQIPNMWGLWAGICSTCRPLHFPAPTKLHQEWLSLAELTALLCPLFDKRPGTVYQQLHYASYYGSINVVGMIGPTGKRVKHANVVDVFKYLASKWPPIREVELEDGHESIVP